MELSTFIKTLITQGKVSVKGSLYSFTQDDLHTEKEVKQIYDQHTAPQKKMLFLDVLEYVNKKKNDNALAETTLHIAYDIVHDEVENGNPSSLHSLKRFLPKDRLIGSDASRYTAVNKLKFSQSKAPQVLHLDQSVTWVKATWQRNQFLVLGAFNDRCRAANKFTSPVCHYRTERKDCTV